MESKGSRFSLPKTDMYSEDPHPVRGPPYRPQRILAENLYCTSCANSLWTQRILQRATPCKRSTLQNTEESVFLQNTQDLQQKILTKNRSGTHTLWVTVKHAWGSLAGFSLCFSLSLVKYINFLYSVSFSWPNLVLQTQFPRCFLSIQLTAIMYPELSSARRLHKKQLSLMRSCHKCVLLP